MKLTKTQHAICTKIYILLKKNLKSKSEEKKRYLFTIKEYITLLQFIERRYAVDMNQLLHLDIVNVCFLRFKHLYCTIVLDPTLRPCRTLTRVISRCCWRQLLRAHRLAPV